MRLIDAHRRRANKTAETEINPISGDFGGYGITRLFSLFKTNLANHDIPIHIRPKTGVVPNTYVKFHTDGRIGLDSPISNNGTGTLNNIVATGDDYFVTQLRCQITDIVADSSLSGATNSDIVKDDALTTKNGHTCINFLGSGGLYGQISSSGFPELDEGNDFSVIGVSSINSTVGSYFSSETGSGLFPRYRALIDTRTQKRHTEVVNGSNTFYYANNISQLSNSDLNVYIATYTHADKTIRVYKNGVFQDSITITGYFNNNSFTIGQLSGHLSCFAISNTVLNSTQITSLTSLLETAANI